MRFLNKAGNFTFTRGVAQITSIHAIPSVRTTTPTINHSLEASNQRKRLLARPGLLGVKAGMITWFTDDGISYPATVIEIKNCETLQVKTTETDGYFSVLLGQIDKLKNVDRSQMNIFESAGTSPKAQIAEFRIRDSTGLIKPGLELKADYFAVGQLVDVQGTTKGKGFAGVMKRHGFGGLNASHGVSRAHRKPGGSGGNQDPGRVLPGKKGPGRMGGNTRTYQNGEVLHTDAEAGILVIKGCVPGPNKAFVKVSDAKKVYGKALNEKK